MGKRVRVLGSTELVSVITLKQTLIKIQSVFNKQITSLKDALEKQTGSSDAEQLLILRSKVLSLQSSVQLMKEDLEAQKTKLTELEETAASEPINSNEINAIWSGNDV